MAGLRRFAYSCMLLIGLGLPVSAGCGGGGQEKGPPEGAPKDSDVEKMETDGLDIDMGSPAAPGAETNEPEEPGTETN